MGLPYAQPSCLPMKTFSWAKDYDCTILLPHDFVISVQPSNQVARWCRRERQFLGLPGISPPPPPKKKSKSNVKEHGPLWIGQLTGIPWHILEPNPRISVDCQYAGDELMAYRDTHLQKLTASPSQEFWMMFLRASC